MGLCFDRGEQRSGSSDIYLVKICLVSPAYGAGTVDDAVTAGEKLFQRSGILQVSPDERDAPGGQIECLIGVSNQRAHPKALFEQSDAEVCSYEPGGASDGDQATLLYQAEATLRRTSSTAALSFSISLALIKSRRALALDSLPEEVRGRE